MKRHMWSGLFVLVLAVALAGCGKKEAQTVTPEMNPADPAIWVDQTAITVGDLQHEMSRLAAGFPQGLSQEQLQKLQANALRQAIDNLVVRQLVQSEMERSGVLISQAEVEEAKKDLEAAMGPGRTLTMLIAEVNLPIEELEENLRLDIFKNKMTREKMDEELAKVTEESAKTFYDENPAAFTQPAGRHTQHILFRVPVGADDAVKAKAKAKAEDVRKALKEGADFAQLAQEVSECLSRTRGGDLGVVSRGQQDPAFEEAVFALPFNQISEVVESPVGYHVIRVTGEQEEQLLPFEQVKNALILQMKRSVQKRLAAEYIAGLREKATIRFDGVLAKPAAEAKPAEAAAAPAEASDAPVETPEAEPAAEAGK